MLSYRVFRVSNLVLWVSDLLNLYLKDLIGMILKPFCSGLNAVLGNKKNVSRPQVVSVGIPAPDISGCPEVDAMVFRLSPV